MAAMKGEPMPALCRDCHEEWPQGMADERCPECGSPRLLRHPELNSLSLAHIDCDAFYATVEKRDDPDLAERPVLVGGRKRGGLGGARGTPQVALQAAANVETGQSHGSRLSDWRRVAHRRHPPWRLGSG